MLKRTSLILNSCDQFNLHYGETLRRWRANFNAVLDDVVFPLGFDAAFVRTWNYYLCASPRPPLPPPPLPPLKTHTPLPSCEPRTLPHNAPAPLTGLSSLPFPF